MWQPPAPLWSCLIKSASWPDTLKTSRLGIHSSWFPGIQEPPRGLSASRQRGFLGTMKAVEAAISQGLGTPTLQPSSPLVLPGCFTHRARPSSHLCRCCITLAWLLSPHPSQMHPLWQPNLLVSPQCPPLPPSPPNSQRVLSVCLWILAPLKSLHHNIHKASAE